MANCRGAATAGAAVVSTLALPTEFSVGNFCWRGLGSKTEAAMAPCAACKGEIAELDANGTVCDSLLFELSTLDDESPVTATCAPCLVHMSTIAAVSED